MFIVFNKFYSSLVCSIALIPMNTFINLSNLRRYSMQLFSNLSSFIPDISLIISTYLTNL